MTLQQYSIIRSLKQLHPELITDVFTRPDGVVLVLQYEDGNELVKTIEILKDGLCNVTVFEKTGPRVISKHLPNKEFPGCKRRKTLKSDEK